ncbi:hypothetical protein BDV41DRAFT_160342 [Aspergillus transmontanensis]|uniref:Uncharacterized protein n=1 Tax=Aspergillus transmontanensis TaxID=1034304 RepID=A0A5N6WFL5_9EURO|nr:hypothetical protein BDV41DRAFT_160342 [Aspergillus transmontanensis]
MIFCHWQVIPPVLVWGRMPLVSSSVNPERILSAIEVCTEDGMDVQCTWIVSIVRRTLLVGTRRRAVVQRGDHPLSVFLGNSESKLPYDLLISYSNPSPGHPPRSLSSSTTLILPSLPLRRRTLSQAFFYFSSLLCPPTFLFSFSLHPRVQSSSLSTTVYNTLVASPRPFRRQLQETVKIRLYSTSQL